MMSLRDYMKQFYNARNAIPYIQDIEIMNAFHDEVSDLKIVEEIAIKKPKMVADLLAVACIEAFEAWTRLLESRGKGPQRRWMIERSTQLTEEILKIMATTASSPQIRRRGGIFGIPIMQRSGARFTAPQEMIWKSARLFWIRRRCHHQQHWHPKKLDGYINIGLILTMMNRWERSL
jgi:hypothetical protein